MNRIASLLLLTILGSPVLAQRNKVPYNAEVVVDQTYVRSAPGEKFYPTKALARGSVVRVVRHDAGGWYQIEPPEGSFSWIRSEYVRPSQNGKGEVIKAGAAVFVGSDFGEESSVYQRDMVLGEEVVILGLQSILTASGSREMFKIEPPAREYRWIKGTDVVPTDEDVRQVHDSNPYRVPSNIAQRRNQPSGDVVATEDAARQTSPKYSPSRQLARLKQIRNEQRALHDLDQKFRFMILSDPSEWDLDKLEQDYLKLQQQTTHKPIAGQIDLRYPAIYRYRQKKAKLDDFNRLTSATEKRDAELMASQYGLPMPQGTSTAQVLPQPSIVASAGPRNFPPTESSLTIPTPTVFDPEMEAIAEAGESNIQNIPRNNKYIGAGFLQRSASAEQKDFLLMSPTGKVLARVTPDDGVNLDEFIGKSVGLQGKRWFDPTIKSDRIEVSGLEPVRIRN